MKPEYDMTGVRRATEIDHLNRLRAGKTRITIMLDDDVLDAFRRSSDEKGIGYQTLINLALRESLGRRPLDEDALRRILREELHHAA
ncbi:hypothetical protein ThidrDRAFT_2593 [Thiorhodococcus drewsii AZ1]|uniref:Uncharacterized protein n=1 Tax=Thiorhodococcus drewsii AZ1 TaxID=765913 RepID=G2E2T0_9GAMM|nr:BrnA antitoxin family protein [Thiorhodococcus drewsii]EGV30634.1 hypothetical protein ThidrDRAFT_2593 [Thiorhodococcus drewsii AZ1]